MARAGKYRDKIRVQTDSTSSEESPLGGNKKSVWVDLDPVSEFLADFRARTGRQRLDAGSVEDTAFATVRLRKTSSAQSISGNHRVVARGLVWRIIGLPIDPDGRGRELEFMLETSGETL